MRLFLVRHYKTQLNVSDHIMGWSDSPPVEESDGGFEFFEQRLRARGVMPDRICCGDLGRARCTSGFYSASFGVSAIDSTRQLTEVNYGELSEKPKKWVAAEAAGQSVL